MRTREAVVTGSAGGIGSAVRTALENAGYRVLGVDLAHAEVHADLADPDARRAAIDEIELRTDGRLDALVVCAVGKLALTRWCRRQVEPWGDNRVRLNVVAPGPVDTPLLAEQLEHPDYGPLVRAFPVPLDRHGTPGEVAAAVRFLLSAEAPWIHGAVLFVDGGTDALVRPESP